MIITFRDDWEILTTDHPEDLRKFWKEYADTDYLMCQLAISLGVDDTSKVRLWDMKMDELIDYADKYYLGGLAELMYNWYEDFCEEYQWWEEDYYYRAKAEFDEEQQRLWHEDQEFEERRWA